MSEPDEVEATKARACVAITMHATTNQKLGAMTTGVIVAIVIAFTRTSFWPFLGGVVVSYVVS